jgi:hypothetical protein
MRALASVRKYAYDYPFEIFPWENLTMKALLMPAFLFCFSIASIPVSQPAPRKLTGKVVDSKNAPVDKAVVYLKNTTSSVVLNVVTATDGSYTFTGLARGTAYEFHAVYGPLKSETRTIAAADIHAVIVALPLQVK